MSEILFIAHRLPFPPDRGDKIRSHHILRRLARIAPVHVATFADAAADFAAEPELAALAASYRLVRRTKPLALAAAQALATGRPVSLTAFRNQELADYVAQIVATRPVSAIYVFSGQMGQYVPHDFAGRLIVDLVDVDSAKFDAYAARGGIRSRVDAREGRLLAAEEARLARRADVTLLISQAEADLFLDRLPANGLATNVDVLGNGIDSATFDPALVAPEPRMLACPGPRLIFTGQMDYAPNIAAARRAMDRIMPLIRARQPGATFHVVGRNPPGELLARHGRDGCHVWGRVDDVRPWLRAADAALIPLEIGRGVQNKVLEAMAMALPVVLSDDAATGIPAHDGEHFAIARDDAGLAQAVLGLAADPARAAQLGQAARRFVVEHVSWNAALAPLTQWVLGPVSPAFDQAHRDAA